MAYRLVISAPKGKGSGSLFFDNLSFDYKVFMFYYPHPAEALNEKLESRLQDMGNKAGENIFVNIGRTDDPKLDTMVNLFDIKRYPVIVVSAVGALASLPYIFSWDAIPGNDNERLINFLKQNFGIDWVKKAKIEKIDSGKTIKASTEIKSLLLKLNNEENQVYLKIDDDIIDEFYAKIENGKLNIYQYSTSFVRIDDRKLLSNPDKTIDCLSILCTLYLKREYSEAMRQYNKYTREEIISQLTATTINALKGIWGPTKGVVTEAWEFIDDIKYIKVSIVPLSFEMGKKG